MRAHSTLDASLLRSAPEILQKNPYTEKADVYSYGVMLWEILTRKLPFDSYTFQHQVEDDVIRGIRPDIPEDCPPVYAKLIRDCWDANPRTRPAFNTVVDVLVGMVRSDIGEDKYVAPVLPCVCVCVCVCVRERAPLHRRSRQ